MQNIKFHFYMTKNEDTHSNQINYVSIVILHFKFNIIYIMKIVIL